MIKTTIALLSTALIAGLSAQTAATPSDDNTTVDTLAETSKYDVENWQVTQPPFKLNEVAISTNETTWSSLDVSPNGKFMIFDMLGDLYKVDIKGGNATPLIQDFAWNIHPAISPDGKQVAFVSDRDGLSNVWVMDIDGTHLKQITREKKNIIHAPKWSPDGEYLVVTKGIMSSRSIPAGEIWMYHKSGGDGLQIKARNSGKRDQQNIADPAFSHDGRYIYFTENTVPGSRFEYNRDPLEGIFAITRYDRESGDERRYISGTGGAVVPTPSPDGKYVAFVRRVKDKTALFLKDIKTGTETPLTFALERDMQEGFGSEGYFTYFDWTPDASAIVYWSRGKFHIIDVDSKETDTLNVHIDTTVKFADALRFPVDVAPDNVEVKMTRWSQMSPNGKSILFQALGKLYVRDVKSGKVKRLTKQNDHDEYYPRYSNDGKSIVYTTWNDQDLGTVRVVSARGGKGKVISVQPGHYIEPSFSTDGKKVVFRKFTGGSLLDPKYSVDPGIYVANLKNDTVEKVADSGYNAHFAGDNERIFFTESAGGKAYYETQLSSVNLKGNDKRTHLYGADKVSEYKLSHDKKWVAFVYQFKTYVTPFVENGKKITVGPNMTSLPVTQLSSRAGEYLTWSADNSTVSWFNGPTLFTRSLDEAFAFVDGAPETLPDPVAEEIDLSFTTKADKPTGYTALMGGKIVTMRDADSTQEVIEDGVVLIKDNRIAAVGKRGEVDIPDNTLQIDTQGKTIIPGLIDAHAHGSQGRNEIIPQQNWKQYSNVSFGVTTIHDPSNDTTEIMAAAELQRTGHIVAPRIYSTGTILYGAEGLGYKAIINNYEDAYFHVERLKEAGAISVKSYNQPRRDQRQQVLWAAKNQKMMVVPEGGGKLQQNLTMLVDGHTGLEHSLPIEKGYSDVTQLWKATKFGYTPTFVVSYGGMMGEEYWYDKTEVWKNPRLLRYTPSTVLDKRAIRRPTAPESQYNHQNVARYAKTLRDNGVSVHIGAHGQREGLAAHWELWIMQQGGFTPWEALRGGTIDGAKHLGMSKDIGSIETGKLADLVVIDGDVLSDIRKSEFVEYTVLNGRVYESATMNEVGSKKKRKPFFFEQDNATFMPQQTADEVEAKAHHYHWEH
ncbi:amidohydrolase [Alteromonas australica]|uniref:amidohydrolase family protein n=1 Tax=Alteromonas australica TaxID=589873 RepID=UPI0005C3E1DC|nr:amidohydrolase family protein [Alteromonas australica]AJP45189.1 amidohydrolase [Alteromonas australica]|tara:strand:+ start:12622 stop:15969 length:3348 start_codon:yes stop_codon:yes gene_type:complete